MMYVVICFVALVASALTFFSGFGLGTLLLPAFAVFFPVGLAVALTAIVHFLNGAFKVVLIWRHVEWTTVWRFGLPAIVGAFAGATGLLWLSDADPLARHSILGRAVEVTPAKLVVGLLLLLFACAELLPRLRDMAFPPRFQPLGGLLSGFFGGLAGMQGALRSAFLVKAGLRKEAYVASGAAIALLIDVSRLSVYSGIIVEQRGNIDYGVLGAAVLAAFAGALAGNRYLPKVTMAGIKTLVAILLFLVAIGLITGVL